MEIVDLKKLVAELCAKLRVEAKKNEQYTESGSDTKRPTMDKLIAELEEVKKENRKQANSNKRMRETIVQYTSELKEMASKAETSKSNYESQLSVAQQQMGREQRQLLEKVKAAETSKKAAEERGHQLEKDVAAVRSSLEALEAKLSTSCKDYELQIAGLTRNFNEAKQQTVQWKSTADIYMAKLEAVELEKKNREEQLLHVTINESEKSDDITKLQKDLTDAQAQIVAEQCEKVNLRREYDNTKQRIRELSKLNRQMHLQMINLRLKLQKASKMYLSADEVEVEVFQTEKITKELFQAIPESKEDVPPRALHTS